MNNLTIITFGEIMPGHERHHVAKRLQQLCKYDRVKLKKVLSGEAHIFKKGLDQSTAERYLSALSATGLVCHIKESPRSPRPQPSSCRKLHPETRRRPLSRKRQYVLLITLAIFVAAGLITVVWKNSVEPLVGSMDRLQHFVNNGTAPPPPSAAPNQVMNPHLSGAEMQQVYDQLLDGNFAKLNQTIALIQADFERDPDYDWKMIQVISLFGDNYEPYRRQLDAWVLATPDHFAPYLARGQYYTRAGWQARGSRWASKTSEDKFVKMRNHFSRAMADFEAALERNPRLLPAYTAMIGIYKAQGQREAKAKTIRIGQMLFPASYQLYKTILKAKLPRWGGSYTAMNRLAHEANEQAAITPKMSWLYGKPLIDQAWYAEKEKNYQKAIDLYSQALAYGAYESLLIDRARAYEALQNSDNAYADYSYAIELNPASSEPYRRRATISFRNGDYTTALRDIRQAQENSVNFDKEILNWYNWTLRKLILDNSEYSNEYLFQFRQYEKAIIGRPYPQGRPLKRIWTQPKMELPLGAQPYGLAWNRGRLYVSSYRNNPGLFEIDPERGLILQSVRSEKIYKDQYGGLTSNGSSLLHIQGHYDNDFYSLGPELTTLDEHYFSASQFHFSDLAYHDSHIYAVAYHDAANNDDYRLLKFSPDGRLRASIAITPVPGRSVSPGLTSDGRWLWCSMGLRLYKIDPASGDIVEGFSLPEAFYGLAWDGHKLWGAGASAKIYIISQINGS